MKKRQLLIFIFLFSCVEHKFSFTVSPNGSYRVEYRGHGDKNDLIDNDFTLPKGKGWIINSTLENTEAESYDYTAHRLFNRNEKFPISFYSGDSIYFESFLKHPIRLRHNNWFFKETYSFDAQIIGRSVSDKYPLVEKFIINAEKPPEGWLKEALLYLLTETLNRVDIEWNTRPIINAELQDWKKNELMQISDSTFFEEIDYYKNIGLDIIMQPASPHLYNDMDSIYKLLEDELTITLDLLDDIFSFQLFLPGILESTNADSSSGDTLFWSFDLQDYMNKDFVMHANSLISYPNRQKAGLLIGFIFLILIWTLKVFRKGKNNPTNLE